MKTIRILTLIILTALLAGISGNAQTVVNITTNTSTSSYGTGAICTNCIINISPGVTLTINNTCSCNTCTFSGGTVNFTSSSNFTFSGLDSIKKATVLINKAFSAGNLVFYGDTVAFNAAMSITGGYRTTIDSSRVSINAALTLPNGTFIKDSLHINSNLTLSYDLDTISNSNIDLATGVAFSTGELYSANSTYAFTGSATMTVADGLTSSNSNYYLAGTSKLNSTQTSTLSGDNIVLSGTTSQFTTTGALTTTSSNLNITGTTGKITAQSLTTTGGAITSATGSTINITNAASLGNTTTSLTGTTFGVQSLTTSGGSFTTSNSPVTSTNVITLANTATSITGSTFKGSQYSISGGSFGLSSTTATSTYGATFTGTAVTMTGTAKFTAQALTMQTSSSLTMTGTSNLSVTYASTFTGSTANLSGNANLSGTSMTLGSNSYFQIGDGSITSGAYVNLSSTFSDDNTSTLAIANNNNYLHSTTSAWSTNTISCGGASPQHACATNYLFGCATVTNNHPLACTVLAEASIDLNASESAPGMVALSFTDNGAVATCHYEIQRSAGNDSWTTIGNIEANGYTTKYDYTDANAPSGRIDYRIERIDEDGKTAFSSIFSVTVTATGNTNIGIHPNPATGGRFYITAASTAEMLVNVYTTTGQLLMHTALQGQTEYPVQLSAQAASLSIVVVQTVSRNTTRSFTVLVHP